MFARRHLTAGDERSATVKDNKQRQQRRTIQSGVSRFLSLLQLNAVPNGWPTRAGDTACLRAA
jgi:hypothetical protein